MEAVSYTHLDVYKRQKLSSLVLLLLLPIPGWASRHTPKTAEPGPPELLLDGGRKLTYERSFGSCLLYTSFPGRGQGILRQEFGPFSVSGSLCHSDHLLPAAGEAYAGQLERAAEARRRCAQAGQSDHELRAIRHAGGKGLRR